MLSKPPHIPSKLPHRANRTGAKSGAPGPKCVGRVGEGAADAGGAAERSRAYQAPSRGGADAACARAAGCGTRMLAHRGTILSSNDAHKDATLPAKPHECAGGAFPREAGASVAAHERA